MGLLPADAPLVATPEGDRGPSALSGWQGAVECLQSGEPIQPPPGTQLREDLTAFALAEPERKFWPGCEGEPANGQQGDLDGIQSLQLTALAKRLGPFRWKHDMVGYELTFDRGLGDAKSNLVLTDCKLDRWRLTPKDGGSIDVVVIAESSDTSAATFGQLAKLKSCEVSFTLTAAEVAQGEIGAAPAPARKSVKPKANDATSEFIERITRRPH